MAPDMNAHGMFDSDALTPDAAEAWGGLIDRHAAVLTELLDGVSEQAQSILADTGLNKQGRAERLKEVGNSVKEIMRTRHENLRSQPAQELERGERQLPTSIAAKDEDRSAARELERQELRHHLANYDPLIVQSTLQSAASGATDADRTLLLAVELSHPLVRDQLIEAKTWETIRAKYFRTRESRKYASVETLRAVVSRLDSNFQAATDALSKALGVHLGREDPVAEAAAVTVS